MFLDTREHDCECPSLTELTESLEAPLPEVEEHLSRCERCRAVIATLRASRLTEAPAVDLGDLPTAKVPQRRPPEQWSLGLVGALVTPYAPSERLLCVVLDPFVGNGTFIEVAPVSTEIGFASDRDLIVPAESSPFGYNVIVELWNHGTALRSQLTEGYGQLSADVAGSAERVYDSMYAADGETIEVSEDVAAQLGPPILGSSDPRSVFQELEAQRARPFWGPAAAVTSGESGRPDDIWGQVASMAADDWTVKEFPVEEIALALVEAPQEPAQIEVVLVEQLRALAAADITKFERTTARLQDDLALAAGLEARQEDRIRDLAAKIRQRVEELRADGKSGDHQ